MINKINQILVALAVAIVVVVSFDYYKKNYNDDPNKDVIVVFSSKEIIENKKLNIKKAILDNGNIKKAENELIQTIETIDLALKEISQKIQKPIFTRESILSGNIKDVTPLVRSKLKEKGLF